MTRSQRKWHVVIWSVLTPVLVAAFTLALINRPPLPKPVLPNQERSGR